VLAVEVPRFGKGSGAKEDPSPASALVNIIMKNKRKSQKKIAFMENLG
jgi:hypothetical protein